MVFWQHMSCMHMFPFGEGCIRNGIHKSLWYICSHEHYGHPAAPDSQKLLFSAIIEPVKILGGSVMALEYTEEKLNSLDKETIKKAPFWQFPRGVPHRTDVHGWADRLVWIPENSFFFLFPVLYSPWGHWYTTEHGVVSGERPPYPEFLYVPSSFPSTNNWELESVHLSFKMTEPICSVISLFAWMTINASVLFLCSHPFAKGGLLWIVTSSKWSTQSAPALMYIKNPSLPLSAPLTLSLWQPLTKLRSLKPQIQISPPCATGFSHRTATMSVWNPQVNTGSPFLTSLKPTCMPHSSQICQSHQRQIKPTSGMKNGLPTSSASTSSKLLLSLPQTSGLYVSQYPSVPESAGSWPGNLKTHTAAMYCTNRISF